MKRRIILSPVTAVLVSVFLTVPVFAGNDRTGTVLLEHRGSRPVWFDVDREEHRVNVYPWGFEGYRRITSGRSEKINGNAGVWRVRMRYAPEDVSFRLNGGETIRMRLRSPGGNRVITSVHRGNEQVLHREFVKTKSSNTGPPNHKTTDGSGSDPDRTVDALDQTKTRPDRGRRRVESGRSYADRNRVRNRSDSNRRPVDYDVHLRYFHPRHRRYPHHSYRHHRYHVPFSSLRYRRYYKYRYHRRHRFRFRLGFHFGGRHDGCYYRFGYHD